MMQLLKIKQGEAFDHTVVIPAEFQNGYFAGCTIRSEVRDKNGVFVAALEVGWVDALTTREIRLFGPTSGWPIGSVYTDILIARASDRLSRYTQTIRVKVGRSVTRVV